MAVLLRIQNVNTYLEGHFPLSEVDKALSFYRPGFFMSRLFNSCLKCKIKLNHKTGRCWKCGRPRAWDGKTHLLLGQNRIPYFPTGCLSTVAVVLHQLGLKLSIKDERTPGLVLSPEAVLNVSLLDPKNPKEKRILWDNQVAALKAAVHYERGVIQTPTSGGKTSIMSAIAQIYNPLNTLVLINNISVAKQLQNEIAGMTGEKVGFIKGGQWQVERITVATTQTLVNSTGLSKTKEDALPEAMELVKNTGVLMLDEAHHTSSNTWFNLCKKFTNTRYRFGVTGTPFMRSGGDDLLLVGATGGLIYEASEQEMIEAGLIARPIIHFYDIDSPDIEEDKAYAEVYQEGVVHNPSLNDLAASMISVLSKDAQILVLCEHLEHIEELSKRLKTVDFQVLTGESPLEERSEAQEKFKNGKLRVLVATKIFDEGISLENIDVIFRMGLLKTDVKSKQQVGRGQRIKKDKPNVVHIIDFFHHTHRYLEKHSQAHLDLYKALGYEIIREEMPLSQI